MKKKLKKYGTTLVLSFSKEEQEMYGLIVGDVIELDEMIFQKVGKKK